MKTTDTTQPTPRSSSPAPAWTPGPWIISSQGNVVDRRLARIATVEQMPGNNPDEKMANAVLMASAPEMARTIQSLTDCLESWWEAAGSPVHATEIELIEARALLARINGEGGAK